MTVSRPPNVRPVSPEEERAFFDDVYRRFLGLPDHALAVNRAIMAADLRDPSKSIFERRRLYEGVLKRLEAENLAGRRVLDYGCGPGEWGVLMATEGAYATLLDLSPAAIELGLRRARASGVEGRVSGVARDASDLSCFEDEAFDLIFASAALHHTLKYPNALAELTRVLKPGGKLLLAETFGNNPILNAARRLRAGIAREAVEQGEGIILNDADIGLLRTRFRRVEVEPLNLLAMAKRLLRGRFTKGWARGTLRALEAADAALLKAFPSLGRYCGEAIVEAQK
ncbi:MAG: class I SAM-dependent methyltransferase [Bryobacteraceae bacterium]|nr:class I SAM-dependent methyltransferase [Bryobacteraceae bacterium]